VRERACPEPSRGGLAFIGRAFCVPVGFAGRGSARPTWRAMGARPGKAGRNKAAASHRTPHQAKKRPARQPFGGLIATADPTRIGILSESAAAEEPRDSEGTLFKLGGETRIRPEGEEKACPPAFWRANRNGDPTRIDIPSDQREPRDSEGTLFRLGGETRIRPEGEEKANRNTCQFKIPPNSLKTHASNIF
jgi:hypothetical protein